MTNENRKKQHKINWQRFLKWQMAINFFGIYYNNINHEKLFECGSNCYVQFHRHLVVI